MREYDFEKVKTQAFAPLTFMGVLDSLYDRATFTFLNKTELEHTNLLTVLKEGSSKNPFRPTEIPALFLFNIKEYLYNEKYIDWNPEYDDQGYIWVQARKNTPRSRLGWAIFEKDMTCRF